MALTKVIGAGLGEVKGANSADLTIDAPTDNATLTLKAGSSDSGAEGAFAVFIQNTTNKWQMGMNTDNSFRLYSYGASAEVLNMDSSGAMIKALQPAFCSHPASDINNLSAGGVSNTTLVFGTERFDQSGDYNNSNGIFTAPVTGKYQLQFSVRLQQVDTATASYDFMITTSNDTYMHRFDPDFGDSDTEFLTVSLGVLADMDASDTAKLEYYINAGSSQTDVDVHSFFSGYLVC